MADVPIPPPSGPPPPIPSPEAPGTNGADPKLSTGEFATLQVEAKREDKERAKKAPASHWDLVKSTVAIMASLAAIAFGFITFGDRVVGRAEGKTAEGVKTVKDDLNRHIEDEKVHHEEVADAIREFKDEVKEQRRDMKALYFALPSRRPQSRLEYDVVEPDDATVRALGAKKPDAGR